MEYLSGTRAELRSDPRRLLPSARSVISLGMPYYTGGPETATVSRYAWGQVDYHDLIGDRLRALASDLQLEWGPFDWKPCVDTSPLLERSWARLAGLGWIGHNTCLINQLQGSWFFLAELLVSLELEPDAPPPDRCGSCRRCIDACPTGALKPSSDGRYTLDARLCISTWTIEQRGTLPEPARQACGDHLFGCDICQQVCPWNRRAPVSPEEAFVHFNSSPDLAEIAYLTDEAFRQRYRRTALWRTRRAGLQRNAATVMGNSADRAYIQPLRHLAQSADDAVSEHARWARARLEAAPC